MSTIQPEPHHLGVVLDPPLHLNTPDKSDGLAPGADLSTARPAGGDISEIMHPAGPSDTARELDTKAQNVSRPMPSQRACTQCQRHKIKCASDASGPCVRCRKHGYLCHIAPRKKRVSRKAKESESLASANSEDANKSEDERAAGASRFDRPTDARENSLPAFATEGTAKPYATSSGSSSLPKRPDESTAAVEKEPEWGQTQQSNAGPQKTQHIAEHMMQSTISSCDQYSVYLSMSFVCPELFRRVVELDWQHNPSVFVPLNSVTRPLFRSLVDSPTSPVYALSFQNDLSATERVSEEAARQVGSWKKKYGETLLDVYFNLVNPVQPLIHRRHFMAAYNANLESTVLLLAIFVAAAPYCSLGTLEDRRTLQTAFLHHIYANYSQKLSMPTMDAVQCLSLIANAAYDRGVLMPHSAAVAAAVEIRLHVDCSDWDIPGWERALRKALWWSLCTRDAWTILRFVGTPKVLLEYLDAPVPTVAELSQLTMHEGDDLALAAHACTVMVNGAPINVSMEACLRSFTAVAKLSEVLLEVNRALYQLRGLRLIRQQPAVAASHIASALELQLNETMSSLAREASDSAQEDMEPDLYKHVIYYFARIAIYCQFLPHRQSSMRTDRFMLDFYTRFLDSIQGILDTLIKFKTVKFSNYWPPWMSHVVVVVMFILYDICIARVAMYIKANNIQNRRSGGDSKPVTGMQQERRRMILLDILNKDRFSSRVLKYTNELVHAMGELGLVWEQPREVYKIMMTTTRSCCLSDVIDFGHQFEPKAQPPGGPADREPESRYIPANASDDGPVPLPAGAGYGEKPVMPPRNMQMLLSPLNGGLAQAIDLPHEPAPAPRPQPQQGAYGHGGTLPQPNGFAGPFGGRMQQQFYKDAAQDGEPEARDITFDDFFSNLSVNLFDGITDLHLDFVL